jgi:hypothetical protein
MKTPNDRNRRIHSCTADPEGDGHMNFRIQYLVACLVTTLAVGCAATVKPSVKLTPEEAKDIRGCLTEWDSLDKDPKTPLPRVVWKDDMGVILLER